MTVRNECTLLELVQTVSDFALTDEEVVATVSYLINSGRVRLCGNFAGAKISMHASLDTFLNQGRTSQPTLAS